jgi:hypothetical protein
MALLVPCSVAQAKALVAVAISHYLVFGQWEACCAVR